MGFGGQWTKQRKSISTVLCVAGEQARAPRVDKEGRGARAHSDQQEDEPRHQGEVLRVLRVREQLLALEELVLCIDTCSVQIFPTFVPSLSGQMVGLERKRCPKNGVSGPMTS